MVCLILRKIDSGRSFAYACYDIVLCIIRNNTGRGDMNRRIAGILESKRICPLISNLHAMVATTELRRIFIDPMCRKGHICCRSIRFACRTDSSITQIPSIQHTTFFCRIRQCNSFALPLCIQRYVRRITTRYLHVRFVIIKRSCSISFCIPIHIFIPSRWARSIGYHCSVGSIIGYCIFTYKICKLRQRLCRSIERKRLIIHASARCPITIKIHIVRIRRPVCINSMIACRSYLCARCHLSSTRSCCVPTVKSITRLCRSC